MARYKSNADQVRDWRHNIIALRYLVLGIHRTELRKGLARSIYSSRREQGCVGGIVEQDLSRYIASNDKDRRREIIEED